MHIKSFAVALLASLTLASSAFAAKQTDEKHTKVGNATYYGDRWHGRRTADGSAYNKDSLTCAHRTLPFGTLLHVRNPKNGKVVVVKVTDRGPYRRNTIIDLSKAAAKQIDMVQAGVASVEVTPGESHRSSQQGENFSHPTRIAIARSHHGTLLHDDAMAKTRRQTQGNGKKLCRQTTSTVDGQESHSTLSGKKFRQTGQRQEAIIQYFDLSLRNSLG